MRDGRLFVVWGRPWLLVDGREASPRFKRGLAAMVAALVLGVVLPWWWGVIPVVLAVYGTRAMWMEVGQ